MVNHTAIYTQLYQTFSSDASNIEITFETWEEIIASIKQELGSKNKAKFTEIKKHARNWNLVRRNLLSRSTSDIIIFDEIYSQDPKRLLIELVTIFLKRRGSKNYMIIHILNRWMPGKG